jgi:hypothetical protein
MAKEVGGEIPAATDENAESKYAITDGVKIYFGGLEFSLEEKRGKGLTLTGVNGSSYVNPEYMAVKDNTARFYLPGGTVLIFSSTNPAGGSELLINAEFAGDISEITIPITPRRSSLIRYNGQLGIMYIGSRYLFTSQNQELENMAVTLSRERAFVSYRSRGNESEFDPANFVIAQSLNYADSVSRWREASFARWNQNTAAVQNEDDIIAYLSETVTRGNYTAAAAAISRDVINTSRHSYRSAGFTGGMSNAFRSFTSSENEKLALVTRLIRERSLDLLKEENILDYLFTRSNTALANDIIGIINNTGAEMLSINHCPGLLEMYSDIKQWRPAIQNPVEPLIEQILLLISENLSRDKENDLVFASNSEGMNLVFSARLGAALIKWAQSNQNAQWEAIGKSLVLSALTNAGQAAGRLHNILKPADHYPRAVWLTDTGIWAWTVSPSVRASYIEGNLNIAASFPVNTAHYMIIRGIRPFIKIQIHGMDWRTDSQFERYDSSGWVYYPQEQILILKLRHRTTAENILVFYREEPQPAVQEVVEPEPEPEPFYQWPYY